MQLYKVDKSKSQLNVQYTPLITFLLIFLKFKYNSATFDTHAPHIVKQIFDPNVLYDLYTL
jgi:hypothetical protein